MKKILITGASGLLGSNLSNIFKEKFDVFSVFNKNNVEIDGCDIIKLDLTDFGKTREIVSEIRPEIIIHCAALTNVDYCEDHPEETDLVNSQVTKNLAEIAREIKCKLIYISTDSVFDGEKGNYTELDETNPINVYAKSKLKGGNIVKELCEDYMIIRTNIYGWNSIDKLSLGEWVLDKASKNEKFYGFSDIFFNPITVSNLGRALLEMCEKDIQGTYNVLGSEKCSKLEFIYKICEVFGLDKEIVIPSKSNVLNLRAPRPKDISLNVEKIQRIIETKLMNVEEGVREFKELGENGFKAMLKAQAII